LSNIGWRDLLAAKHKNMNEITGKHNVALIKNTILRIFYTPFISRVAPRREHLRRRHPGCTPVQKMESKTVNKPEKYKI